MSLEKHLFFSRMDPVAEGEHTAGIGIQIECMLHT